MTNEILQELKEQTKWLRFLSLPGLKDAVDRYIKTDDQRMIYGLSDGDKSTNDISKALKSKGMMVSHMTVYNYWKRWYALGLVVPSKKYSGRFQRIIDLADLNL